MQISPNSTPIFYGVDNHSSGWVQAGPVHNPAYRHVGGQGQSSPVHTPPPEVEPQRFSRQCLRQCAGHLAIGPDSGTEGKQGLSEAESEETSLF